MYLIEVRFAQQNRLDTIGGAPVIASWTCENKGELNQAEAALAIAGTGLSVTDWPDSDRGPEIKAQDVIVTATITEKGNPKFRTFTMLAHQVHNEKMGPAIKDYYSKVLERFGFRIYR